MLYAALVSWAVTRVTDALLPTLAVVLKITWEKVMKLVKQIVRLAEMLVVNTICSAVIVVGVQLERLVHVARAVGSDTSMPLYGALALTTSCSSILKIICMLRDGIDVRIRRAWNGENIWSCEL